MTANERLRLGFFGFLLVVFAAALVVALDFRVLARYMPVFVTGLGIVTSLAFLAFETVNIRKRARAVMPAGVDGEIEPVEAGDIDTVTGVARPSRSLNHLGIMIAFAVAVYVVGLSLASVIYVVVALRFQAHTRWRYVVISVAAVLIVLAFLVSVMGLALPDSLLPELILIT